MPTTLPGSPEPDYLYWRPKLALGLPSRERGWIGRIVTVKHWQVCWDKTGELDKQGEPVWSARYLGFVQEINKYVPGEELSG